ncbi:MAG TPA: hypothetical protein VKG20_19130, partial [Methylomirabilota bacterium]|nr:hypothetical protein [Methylomirabilota bacterium]
MRALALIVISMCTALAPAAAAAQDAAELRKQIEELQKQLDAVTDRLRKLEAQPPPPAPAGAPTPTTAPAAQAQPPAAATPSAMDVVRPRQPFGLYQQRGAGQLLFDIGITGDFVGNLTQRNVEKAQGGTFSGQENRFFPREVELSLFGQIDPYASAVVRIEAGEEGRGQETPISLAE